MTFSVETLIRYMAKEQHKEQRRLTYPLCLCGCNQHVKMAHHKHLNGHQHLVKGENPMDVIYSMLPAEPNAIKKAFPQFSSQHIHAWLHKQLKAGKLKRIKRASLYSVS